ncbi:4'-phosphopantetheinyl transferase family protein [Variovorax ginsengisoli]|uniref:4'-phosphopantetheinyl transferase n=1 Tax=Variovorax ginsengisoli TaxID=363844 RepID=A0ABT9SBJ1_9BURK|nr:4'-phosphopantetheinyl transferase superfamily protein [Variovorax ginsengisoli]MDP9901721.1 4'-phosphopantetheinyl transferase [Variovorax ginsengisoli]
MASTAACRALLTPQELAQQDRFHFARDRHRYLLTRALVRSVLSRYAPVPAQTWSFGKGAFGRPRIEAPLVHEARGLNFNLSHTDGLIVMALARDIDLGIDAENIDRRAPLDVADQFFSPAESAALNALPPALQAERFFALWTLKESYIKARGMGLQLALDSFSFMLDDSACIEFALADPNDHSAQRWHFWQLQPTPAHRVAVCAAPDRSVPARIVCREVLALQSDQPLSVPTIRTSGCTPSTTEGPSELSRGAA